MRIAIQGQKGAFHEIASHRVWKDQDLDIVYCETFEDVFKKVKNGQVDFGVTAVENSLYGSILATYDLLLNQGLWIAGEITLHIHQQLISHPEARLEDIKEVYSQTFALEQCRRWLSEHIPNAELIEFHDTAASVRYIKEKGLRHAAAIASDKAAEDYDMPILARDIEDEENNFTRFIVISKEEIDNPNANRASLSMTAHHKPGALYGALGILFNLGINLTKLESRPIRNERFLYQFIVELEADKIKLDSAVEQLKDYGCDVTVLGHFVTHE